MPARCAVAQPKHHLEEALVRQRLQHDAVGEEMHQQSVTDPIVKALPRRFAQRAYKRVWEHGLQSGVVTQARVVQPRGFTVSGGGPRVPLLQEVLGRVGTAAAGRSPDEQLVHHNHEQIPQAHLLPYAVPGWRRRRCTGGWDRGFGCHRHG
jgi:hypothetical protein